MSTLYTLRHQNTTNITNMKKGRPPKQATGTTSTITLKIPAHIKNHITQTAEAYDLTITDYLLTLVHRDTPIGTQNTNQSHQP